jgi:hypothetical protein
VTARRSVEERRWRDPGDLGSAAYGSKKMTLRLWRRVRVAPGGGVNASSGLYTTGARADQSPPAMTTPIGALIPLQPTRVSQRLAVALAVLAGLAMLVWAIVAAPH